MSMAKSHAGRVTPLEWMTDTILRSHDETLDLI